jgi:hypothetical protein
MTRQMIERERQEFLAEPHIGVLRAASWTYGARTTTEQPTATTWSLRAVPTT